MMRLFTSVCIPEAIRRQIPVPGRGRMKPVAGKNLHITLRFVGERDDAATDAIRQVLRSVKFEPFSVLVADAGCFPARKNPKVLWIGLEPAGKLENLYRLVDEALLKAGVPQGDKRFHPHITVARPGPDSRAAALEFLDANRSAIFGEFVVDEFVLCQSILRREGPEYVVLEKYGGGRGRW